MLSSSHPFNLASSVTWRLKFKHLDHFVPVILCARWHTFLMASYPLSDLTQDTIGNLRQSGVLLVPSWWNVILSYSPLFNLCVRRQDIQTEPSSNQLRWWCIPLDFLAVKVTLPSLFFWSNKVSIGYRPSSEPGLIGPWVSFLSLNHTILLLTFSWC